MYSLLPSKILECPRSQIAKMPGTCPTKRPNGTHSRRTENPTSSRQPAAEITRPPPPAAERIRRQLPTICIRSEDLQANGNNADCVICLEPLVVGRRDATRLPSCAHLFHSECIQDWLERSCACPTCRYELPTDDAAFERGRAERMRFRKPRTTRESLMEMSVRDLRALCRGNRNNSAAAAAAGSASNHHGVPDHIKDRRSLIDYVIAKEYVELIPSPPVVSFRLSDLRSQYSVKRLRTLMNDTAGVFFDPKDVVEKEDMIQIFLASGRLQVVPEVGAVVEVETVESESEDDDEEMRDRSGVAPQRTNLDLVMEENDRFGEQPQQQQNRSRNDPAAINLATLISNIVGSCASLSPEQRQVLLRHLECRPVPADLSHILEQCNELDQDQVHQLIQRLQQEDPTSTRTASNNASTGWAGVQHNTSTSRVTRGMRARAQMAVNEAFFMDWSNESLIILLENAVAMTAADDVEMDASLSTRATLMDELRTVAAENTAAYLYFQAVAPLAPLTLEQLRAVGRMHDIPPSMEVVGRTPDEEKVSLLHQIVMTQLEQQTQHHQDG